MRHDAVRVHSGSRTCWPPRQSTIIGSFQCQPLQRFRPVWCCLSRPFLSPSSRLSHPAVIPRSPLSPTCAYCCDFLRVASVELTAPSLLQFFRAHRAHRALRPTQTPRPMHRILGGIYVSGFEPLANDVDLARDHGITHILLVLPGPIPPRYRAAPYTHKQIAVTDEETTNLLQYFAETNAFMELALFPPKSASVAAAAAAAAPSPAVHAHKILVHCAQGVLRSAAVVIAYLMQKYRLNYKQALHALTRKNPGVQPNPAFVEQLEIFLKMLQLRLDYGSKLYRQFLIDITLKQDPSGDALRLLGLADPPTKPLPLLAPRLVYRCKRCRHVLATDIDVQPHQQPTEDLQQLRFVKRGHTNRVILVQQGSAVCSHYFLAEPLKKWMQQEVERKQIEGRFLCPTVTCGAKIGGYSWRGSRCSCGKWVIPAFHLNSSRVDEVKAAESEVKTL